MAFQIPERTSLSKLQLQIIHEAILKRKMAVIGGPGTGKTILAMQLINDAIASGKKCQFIVYSRPLAEFIETNIKSSKALSKTACQWLYNYLLNVVEIPKSEIPKLQYREYVYNYDLVEEEVNKIPLEQRIIYDYVFLDEAQDLPIRLIDILSKTTKQIFVTYDDQQKIGLNDDDADNDSFRYSEILSRLSLGEEFYDLIYNYRNTIEIERLSKLFGDNYSINNKTLRKITAQRNGETPSLIDATESTKEEIVDYIVEKFDGSRSIGVLYNAKLGEAYFNEYDMLFREKCQQDNWKYISKFGTSNKNTGENLNQNCILLISTKSSKGLEFDDVYIIDDGLMKCESYIERNKIYVAITRARKAVNIIYTDSNSYIAKTILDYNQTIVRHEKLVLNDEFEFESIF